MASRRTGKWIHADDELEVKRGAANDIAEVVTKIRATMEERQWIQASSGRLGSGFHYGEPLVKPTLGFIANMKRDERHAAATVAMQFVSAGLMLPKRCNEMWPIFSFQCDCGQWLPDEAHCFLGLPTAGAQCTQGGD